MVKNRAAVPGNSVGNGTLYLKVDLHCFSDLSVLAVSACLTTGMRNIIRHNEPVYTIISPSGPSLLKSVLGKKTAEVKGRGKRRERRAC